MSFSFDQSFGAKYASRDCSCGRKAAAVSSPSGKERITRKAPDARICSGCSALRPPGPHTRPFTKPSVSSFSTSSNSKAVTLPTTSFARRNDWPTLPSGPVTAGPARAGSS
jgi:hypothetical protein